MSKKPNTGKVIGIDLGTTNSAGAYFEAGKATIIPTVEGGRLTPSVIAFQDDDSRIVGELAKRQAVSNPQRTVREMKRDMGTTKKFKINDKDYTPQELSAMVLQKVKADAEAYFGEEITKSVITVPAYFTDSQKVATKDAGRIAGLEVLRIINEPTAAALAYGLDKDEEQTILVFDLGGGTFDVSILELSTGVFEVIATNGNNRLGGTDMDKKVIDWMVEEFNKQTGMDIRGDHTAMQRIRDAAEEAKIQLSSMQRTRISLPYLSADQTGPKHLELDLSRSKFESMITNIIDQTLGPTKKALSDASITPNDIHKVLLIGGATRVPAVQKAITDLMGKEPDKGINPDEAVALGAAIQAGVLSGTAKDILLLDVTPLSLGVETLGNVMTKLIERNTTIPVSKSEVFSTAADNQTSVEIHVLQGERAMAKDNLTLGRFSLVGIPPAPRGIPQIEVKFDIDVNGIVNVTATDKGTGKEQRITITRSEATIDESEIERMVADAQDYADQDAALREKAEITNQSDSLIYTVEKTIKDLEEKVTDDEKDEAQAKIVSLRQAIEAEDVELMKTEMEALQQVMHKFSERLYQQPEGQQPDGEPFNEPPSGTPGPAPKDEDFIDVDWEPAEADNKEQ
ncbi:MAG: molecular chaperone DnaK [Candidatus Kariarchaeaceae archaeon]